jgi:hypothetical protein
MQAAAAGEAKQAGQVEVQARVREVGVLAAAGRARGAAAA